MPIDDMLREVINTMQIRGEPHRRWFASESFDLIVWLSENGKIIGFQLCYNKGKSECAVTWRAKDNTLTHMMVDDGEAGGGGSYKATPILKPGGKLNPEQVLRDFLKVVDRLPAEVVAAVVNQLEAAANEAKA